MNETLINGLLGVLDHCLNKFYIEAKNILFSFASDGVVKIKKYDIKTA